MEKEEQIFFEEKYLRLYEPLYRFLYQLCSDAQAAEDLVQETFTESLSRIAQIRLHPNADGWFYVTARNKALNYLRLRHHQDQMNIDDEEKGCQYGTSASVVEDTVLKEYFQFSQLKEVLKEEEIRLLCLRFDEGYEVKEIARYLKVSEGSCKMRFSRIYGKLRAHPELFHWIMLLILICSENRG